MHGLRHKAKAQGGRLLRVLLVRLGAVSADAGRACGRERRGFLLHGLIRHGKRYGPKLARLAAQAAHQPFGVVDSTGRHPCRFVHARACSRPDLDNRAHLDGDGVHSECTPVWAHSLPLHGALLPRHDRAGAGIHLGYHFPRVLWMARIGSFHSRREQGHLVGYRAGMGNVLVDSRYKPPLPTCAKFGIGKTRTYEQVRCTTRTYEQVRFYALRRYSGTSGHWRWQPSRALRCPNKVRHVTT